MMQHFAKIKDQFKAGCLSEDEILTTIKTCFNETGYLLDTHTAIGYGVLKQYQQETGDLLKQYYYQLHLLISSLNQFIKLFMGKNLMFIQQLIN